MSDFDPEVESLQLRMLTWKARAENAEAQIAELERALKAAQRRERELTERVESSLRLADRLTTHLEARDEHVERLVKEATASQASTYTVAAADESTASSTDDSSPEPYRARSPRKKKKLDPDERYQLLCQLAARARCARKNLSPSARRRMIEQARELNALPDDELD